MREKKGNGLVSGVCYDPDTKKVIVVLDLERKINGQYKFALPGGMVEPEEAPIDAMEREWSEEVGAKINEKKLAISRSRKGGGYNHYFYKIKLANQKIKLRHEGFSGETGPPLRVSLKNLILGNAPMHFSHLKGLCLTLKKEALEMARGDKEIAFALLEMRIIK